MPWIVTEGRMSSLSGILTTVPFLKPKRQHEESHSVTQRSASGRWVLSSRKRAAAADGSTSLAASRAFRLTR